MVIIHVCLATISTEHEAIWRIFKKCLFIWLQHTGSSLHYADLSLMRLMDSLAVVHRLSSFGSQA